MQYEVIILELLSRIQKLESEVEQLKNRMDALTTENVEEEENTGRTRYTKLTDQMIMLCYEGGKKLRDGENLATLSKSVVEQTGMNRSSAVICIYAVACMLKGTIYKRAISKNALEKYLNLISEEYGSTGLKKALKATKEHIRYRHVCGQTVRSIEQIYAKYENRN